MFSFFLPLFLSDQDEAVGARGPPSSRATFPGHQQHSTTYSVYSYVSVCVCLCVCTFDVTDLRLLQCLKVLFEKLCLHERCENKKLPKTVNTQQQSTSEAAVWRPQKQKHTQICIDTHTHAPSPPPIKENGSSSLILCI